MATDYSQLYNDNTVKLAKTMVIKSATSADLINTRLTMLYGNSIVNKDDLKTWKYYLNISGQYHVKDTVMQVISLDTLETIDFTSENLAIHTATKAAYEYGSRYYYALIDKYPEQEQLILGILYPVDLTTAVNAKDYTILGYPTGLVEPQEITLIQELQSWVYRYLIRWDVQAFGISDTLYPVAQHAIFYLNLLLKIFNLRLKRCKTSEAHSFHIRSYLASHCGLDKYYDYMTLKQALFLYRNINYLERNPGKVDTFNWLVEKILTDRDIPIAEYQARLEGNFDNDFYPEYKFKKIPINTEFNTPDQNYFTLEQLLSKEKYQAIGNIDYITFDKETIDSSFKNSVSSSLLTKNLESSMTDYTGNQINPLSDVLFNHWGWLAVNNKYHVAVSFKNPVTSAIMTMFSDDAFIYYIYLLMMSIGAPVERIPKFILKRVQKTTLPTVAEMMAMVDLNLVKDTTIPVWLLENQPKLKTCYSVNSFYNLATDIFNAEQAQWRLVSGTEHYFLRAIVDNLCNQLYEDVEVTFSTTGDLYATWLKDRSLPTDLYSPQECIELMSNLMEAATGYSIDPTKVIGNIQKAMLSIMTDLSSYSVKFIQEINESPVKLINWAAIRVGDVITSGSNTVYNGDRFGIIDIQTSVDTTESFRITPDHFVEISDVDLSPTNTDFDHVLTISVEDNTYKDFPMMFGRIELMNITGNESYDNFSTLTTEQKYSLYDIYGSKLANTAPTPTIERPISDAIIFNNLNSLKYIDLADQTIDLNDNQNT